jgi:hypothetical protein
LMGVALKGLKAMIEEGFDDDYLPPDKEMS